MRLILCFLIVLPIFAISQEPLEYSEIINVSNVDKNELFIRGGEWFNENFKSKKNVLQINDKENGILSGKGIMEIPNMLKNKGKRKFTTNVIFQMNLWVKNGKYNYELTNFDIPGDSKSIAFGLITTANETNVKYPGNSAEKMNEIYSSIKQAIELKVKLLINDLKSKMSKKSKSSDG